MTTHTGAKYEEQFHKDWQNLQNDVGQWQADSQAEQGYVAGYQAAWQAIVNQEGHVSPWTLLILFMNLMANQGSDELNEKLAVQGDQLKVQTDIGKLNNDISNMMNDTQVTNGATNTSLPTTPAQPGESGNPESGGGAATNLVIFTATHLDKILDALKSGSLQQILGTSGASNLSINFLNLRQQIYLGDGDSYDPTLPTGTAAPSFAFDVSASGNYLSSCFNSFNEVHRLAAEKGNSGAGSASTVLTNLSTPINTNTSMLQSTQASANQYISETTNIIKTILTAVSNFGHSEIDVMKAANQNMGR